jgi:hypothetical protein
MFLRDQSAQSEEEREIRSRANYWERLEPGALGARHEEAQKRQLRNN